MQALTTIGAFKTHRQTRQKPTLPKLDFDAPNLKTFGLKLSKETIYPNLKLNPLKLKLFNNSNSTYAYMRQLQAKRKGTIEKKSFH